MTAQPLQQPQKGEWVNLGCHAGKSKICRFLQAKPEGDSGDMWWLCDHAAHGPARDTFWIPEASIASVERAKRPPLQVVFTGPGGLRCCVGHYATREDAEIAMAARRLFASDIRIEERAS